MPQPLSPPTPPPRSSPRPSFASVPTVITPIPPATVTTERTFALVQLAIEEHIAPLRARISELEMELERRTRTAPTAPIRQLHTPVASWLPTDERARAKAPRRIGWFLATLLVLVPLVYAGVIAAQRYGLVAMILRHR
jgi:hypothetical protein